MTARDFAYWLQGYFELLGKEGPGGLTATQVQVIKDHLGLVLRRVTGKETVQLNHVLVQTLVDANGNKYVPSDPGQVEPWPYPSC